MTSEDRVRVRKGLSIPLSEVTWRATTSGGPGGQHANRTLSRVEVQFDIEGSPSLGPRQRARLLERYGPVLRTSASDSRSQARNRQLALERLARRLDRGLRVDPERRPTRPTKASQVRRVDEKRRRSETKRRRRAPGEDDRAAAPAAAAPLSRRSRREPGPGPDPGRATRSARGPRRPAARAGR